MIYMRNITITTAKSATYLENVGPCASTSKSCTGRTAAKPDLSLGSGDRRRQSEGRPVQAGNPDPMRSEEHTSELQSLMRISYAVFCLKKKTNEYRLNEIHYDIEQESTRR